MNRGQSLVELLIALGIFVTMISVAVFVLLSSYVSNLKSGENSQALFLAEEGLEAVRAIRNNDWDDLAAGSYGLAVFDSDWTLSGSQEDISSKLKEGIRQVIVENIDSGRKKITSKITWKSPQNLSQEISLVSRLTNWEGLAKWVEPTEEGFLNLSGSQNGLKVQVQGNYAYLVRDGGNPDFFIIDITNTQNPFLAGSVNLSGGPRDVAVYGNYAYVASNEENQELQIVDISNPSSPSVLGVFNAQGGAGANGIYFSSSTAYLVRNSSSRDEFLAINVSDPESPVLIGSLNLGATGNDIVVLDSYAYVSSSLDSQELQIIDLTDPEHPAITEFYNLSGSSNGISITGFGEMIILSRSNDLIYLFNVGNPNAPVFLGSFDAGGEVNDMALDNDSNYIFLATSENSAEFQVVDISQPASPTLVGMIDLASGNDVNGIAFDRDKDRVFVASESNNEEFIVLAP